MTEEVNKSASKEDEVKEAGKKDKQKNSQEKDDLFFILNDPRGRRFVWKYLSACGIYEQSMTGNSYTFFNEGKRSIGLKLLAEVTNSAPDLFVKMMNESKEGDRHV